MCSRGLYRRQVRGIELLFVVIVIAQGSIIGCERTAETLSAQDLWILLETTSLDCPNARDAISNVIADANGVTFVGLTFCNFQVELVVAAVHTVPTVECVGNLDCPAVTSSSTFSVHLHMSRPGFTCAFRDDDTMNHTCIRHSMSAYGADPVLSVATT